MFGVCTHKYVHGVLGRPFLRTDVCVLSRYQTFDVPRLKTVRSHRHGLWTTGRTGERGPELPDQPLDQGTTRRDRGWEYYGSGGSGKRRRVGYEGRGGVSFAFTDRT